MARSKAAPRKRSAPKRKGSRKGSKYGGQSLRAKVSKAGSRASKFAKAHKKKLIAAGALAATIGGAAYSVKMARDKIIANPKSVLAVPLKQKDVGTVYYALTGKIHKYDKPGLYEGYYEEVRQDAYEAAVRMNLAKATKAKQKSSAAAKKKRSAAKKAYAKEQTSKARRGEAFHVTYPGATYAGQVAPVMLGGVMALSFGVSMMSTAALLRYKQKKFGNIAAIRAALEKNQAGHAALGLAVRYHYKMRTSQSALKEIADLVQASSFTADEKAALMRGVAAVAMMPAKADVKQLVPTGFTVRPMPSYK